MNTEPQKEHQWLQKLVGEWTYETDVEMKNGRECAGVREIEMNYYYEKAMEYRLDESRRAQRNEEFARAVKAARRPRRKGPRTFREMTSWTPQSVQASAEHGGAR